TSSHAPSRRAPTPSRSTSPASPARSWSCRAAWRCATSATPTRRASTTTCSAPTPRRSSGSASSSRSIATTKIAEDSADQDHGQALYTHAGMPPGELVLHGVDQLAHEARREVDPRHDHAGHRVHLDLVVDARGGDRELVVRVADVLEVRVVA